MEQKQLYFRRLEQHHERPIFDCGDSDLNEFFALDSKEGSAQLISVTYAVETESNEVVCFFCLSNDAIRKQDTSNRNFNKIRSKTGTRYSSLPAVKIGRLATSKIYQSNGIGTQVLDYIKMWFTEGNKTGCRFIIVDAVNKEKTLNFYKRNGFSFLKEQSEPEDHTRLMFFDLLTFRR